MGHSIKQNFKENKSVTNTPTKIFDKNKKIQEQLNDLRHVPNSGHSTERSRSVVPTLSEVEEYFKSNAYSLDEAKKFFLYNQGKAWMLTDKVSIKDWQALAHKWMLNNKKTVNKKPPETENSNDINYLFERFIEGHQVFKFIHPEHFEQLQIQITEATLEEARQERINQVSGTNQHSLNQLWQAYLSNNPNFL